MLIDFDEPIRDLKGKPVSPGENEVMTLGSCCVAALQHLYPGEDATEMVKARRFKLAVRISAANHPIELSNDEVATLKVPVAKFWNPLVMGKIYEAIDPEGLRAL